MSCANSGLYSVDIGIPTSTSPSLNTVFELVVGSKICSDAYFCQPQVPRLSYFHFNAS